MADLFLIFGAVLLVSLVSLVGILLLPIGRKPGLMIYLVSFSAGALFGDALLHLIPEAFEDGIEAAGFYVLAGILLFFIIEKFIRWHHHHVHPEEDHIHVFGYMNLIGDAAHNLLDGLIIAGAFLASVPLGIATTLAVVFHEIPQEISDFGVLLHAGFSRARALMFNFLSALVALVGAGIAILLDVYIGNIASVLVPMAAGSFIYIAGSDLIPELHKETSRLTSALQLLAFLLGVGTMAALLLLE